MKRLLIAGYGDIARRASAMLPATVERRLVSRSHGRDLDHIETLGGLENWADALLYCAPPQAHGDSDLRSANLLAVLQRGGILPTRIVYISTSGVYGDCAGALVDETRTVNPHSTRAVRRVAAERQFVRWSEARDLRLVILRAPGIYAQDRLPLDRLRAATPVLDDADDVYTNHIHADDLAAIAVRALGSDAPAGTYNASDDAPLKMAAWFDLLAERFGLPRAPRVSRIDAGGKIPAALLSFMSESRRLDNRKLKTVFGVKLRYPTVYDGVPLPGVQT